MNLFDVFTEYELAEASASVAADKAARVARRKELADVPRARNFQAMLDSVAGWTPPELPSLAGFSQIIVNVETTGVKWWAGDRIISCVVKTPAGSYYLPIGHKLGVNIDRERWREWARRELRNKRIVNINTRFDLHMFRAEGIDLEAQGCTFGDVAHYAGLLDDRRRRFNLDLLSYDLLGWDLDKDGLGKLPPHIEHEGQFQELPAGIVAPYGIRNVEQVALLLDYMAPRLAAEDLGKVAALEDKVIPIVVEMEHNGAPIDVELLNAWIPKVEADIKQCLYNIRKATGIDMESIGNKADRRRLFDSLHVPIPNDPETGKPSFADALIKDIQEPTIQEFRKGSQLASLNSKFLLKYQRSTARDGILRYALHQMPFQDAEDGHGGAVSGRFSSAAPTRDEGANIQQVFGVDAQKKKRPYTADYLVKRLFKPAAGVMVNADASQLQFRIFAHYGEDPKIIAAYERDRDWRGIAERKEKLTDFHDVVGDLVKQHAGKVLTRTHTKNVNFAQVFGAGVPKMAEQLEVPYDQIPTPEEWMQATKAHETDKVGGPRFQEVVQLSATYHEMFPGVKPLLATTAHLAMPRHREGKQRLGSFDTRGCGKACRELIARGYPHRGWVRTFLGRRRRFLDNDRFYSALNCVIQGTEADYIKVVMCAVHERRHELGFTERFQVHDALVGDLQGDPQAFKEVLNFQHLPMKVLLLWEVGTGATWAEAK